MKSKVTNELWVVQANALATSQAVEKVKKTLLSLSLTDRRLMAMLIAKVDPYMKEAEFPMMQVSVTEFQQMNGLEVGAGRAFDALKDSIITLMGTVIQFPDHENPKRRRMAQLLADGEYIAKDTMIPVFTAAQFEYDVPAIATSDGILELSIEKGTGSRGVAVSEVWLIRK